MPLGGHRREQTAPVAGLSVRPPTFCPGCPHRGVFLALKRLKVYVSGDIGCYTMASIAPWDIMHSMMCMGASIGMAHGMEKALRRRGLAEDGVVAVIGDSTFFHSGMTALLDVAWNRGNSVTIILDNRAVAMTGGQPTPGSGTTLMGDQTRSADVAEVARALGVDHVVVADPFDLRGFEEVVKTALASPEPWVIVSKAPCALQYKIKNEPFEVDAESLHRVPALSQGSVRGPQLRAGGRASRAWPGAHRSRGVHRVRRLRAAMPSPRHPVPAPGGA